MSDTLRPKRSYTSPRRHSQAEQTRRLILEAARKLFYERGYSSTTIEAIAQEAGVAPETIYAVFGNKLAVLRKLVDIIITGDERPIPLLERPFIREAMKENDQRAFINQFAKDICQIMHRMSPVFYLLRSTAKTDPDIAVLLESLLKGRQEGMSMFTDRLGRIGPLRDQILSEQARDTAWVISSAEVFDLLTRDLGWPEERYITWLSDSLARLLLP
jgi:TetR/AcrR family transcriptional regulator, regulator of autoinduction and epiphytic fitness